MASKPTKRDMFEAIAGVLETAGETELVEFDAHQVELLDKRASSPRKPTAAQIENEAIKSVMVDVLEDAPNGLTATEVATAVDISVQKASQLLKQLKESGLVTKVEAKGKEKARFYTSE